MCVASFCLHSQYKTPVAVLFEKIYIRTPDYSIVRRRIHIIRFFCVLRVLSCITASPFAFNVKLCCWVVFVLGVFVFVVLDFEDFESERRDGIIVGLHYTLY